MLVAEILKSKGGDVFSVAPDITLSDACAELDSRRVGALIVCDGDRVVGVISERDVVKAVAAGTESRAWHGQHHATSIFYAENGRVHTE